MASYARCFRPRLHGQLVHCQQYVKGLFHGCRSNVERMNERLPASSYDALPRFISESTWDGQRVMDEVARRVPATLAEVAGEQGLLPDACGWEKAGHKSVGVGRQYLGQEGNISNGQVGVFAVLSRGTSAGLVGGQLFLPAAWCTNAARCVRARVPAAGGPGLPEQAGSGGGARRPRAGPGAGARRLGGRGRGLRPLAGPAPGRASARSGVGA